MHLLNRCLLEPECGLCFTRSGRAVPLSTWEWRRRLGPVTQADRLGHFRRERCDRVSKRGKIPPGKQPGRQP
jgi:hypothetical protein